MRMHSESLIAHPVDEVFKAYRDRLSEVTAYLPEIREIIVESREQLEGSVKLHNVWVSDKDVPAIAKKFITPDQLRWDDYATWFDEGPRAEWTIKTRAFTEAVSCSGSTSFKAEGDKTRVVLEGNLDIDLKQIPGVPKFMVKSITPQIEKFIVGLIKPNLEKNNVAIGEFLDAQA